jgi:pyrroline-5-carboxylate reductase
MDFHVTFIGGGNMGRDLARAASGALGPARVLVAERDAASRAKIEALGIPAVETVREAVARSGGAAFDGLLVLATKPQGFAEVASELHAAGWSAGACTTLSIMAGVSTGVMRERLGPAARVVRSMPNLCVRVGLGMSAICPGPGTDSADLERARALLSAVGRVEIIDESLMDAFTAVAGSGPAYVFALAEWMEAGARALGLDPLTARGIVAQTILGSATVLAAGSEPFGDLRAAVTSKGGTTEAALGVLREHRVAEAFESALRAARDRGAELREASR